MTKRIYAEAIADRKERLDYFSEPITCPECGATSDKLKPGHQMNLLWSVGWSVAPVTGLDLFSGDPIWDPNQQDSIDMTATNMPFGEAVPQEHYVHIAGTEVCHRWRVEHRVSFAARVCEVFIKLRVDYPLGLVKQYREYIDASETTQVGYLKTAQSILTMASVEGRKDL